MKEPSSTQWVLACSPFTSTLSLVRVEAESWQESRLRGMRHVIGAHEPGSQFINVGSL
jgi:hypothetical protein